MDIKRATITSARIDILFLKAIFLFDANKVNKQIIQGSQLHESIQLVLITLLTLLPRLFSIGTVLLSRTKAELTASTRLRSLKSVITDF